jgi:hypothetical protein
MHYLFQTSISTEVGKMGFVSTAIDEYAVVFCFRHPYHHVINRCPKDDVASDSQVDIVYDIAASSFIARNLTAAHMEVPGP